MTEQNLEAGSAWSQCQLLISSLHCNNEGASSIHTLSLGWLELDCLLYAGPLLNSRKDLSWSAVKKTPEHNLSICLRTKVIFSSKLPAHFFPPHPKATLYEKSEEKGDEWVAFMCPKDLMRVQEKSTKSSAWIAQCHFQVSFLFKCLWETGRHIKWVKLPIAFHFLERACYLF